LLYITSYKLRQVTENQFVISIPTYFSANQKLKQGCDMHCYIGNKGELIYRPTLSKKRGRILYKTYVSQTSGTRSLKVTIPPVFRDSNKLKNGQSLHCWMDEEEVVFRKTKPKKDS
jgi:hypothetical protein